MMHACRHPLRVFELDDLTMLIARMNLPGYLRLASLKPKELNSSITLARTSMTDLEVGFSARNETEFNELLRSLEAFRLVNVEAHHFDRARRVQRSLAAAGLEGRKVPDLLIAAVAESESPTVLHQDADLDHIGSITVQPTEWIAPRDSVD